MQTILAVVIVGAAMAFAWYYMQNAEKKRAARDAEKDRAEQIASGLPDGVRALCENDPDLTGAGPCVARDILDDGLAHNSKWVTNEFLRVYWSNMNAGAGMADAFMAAMRAEKWCSGSQGQVIDRLRSKNKIDEVTKNRLKAQVESDFPSGYGICS